MNTSNGRLIWLTGLSGAGKTTIASALQKKLKQSVVLDGDELRRGLNNDLGFNEKDRSEAGRRIGEVAKLFVTNGWIVIVSSISPYSNIREYVRSMLRTDEFVEVYVECPLDICEQRDPKGLYGKARSGEIRNFTGISDPYEPPVSPEVICRTHLMNIEECVESILRAL